MKCGIASSLIVLSRFPIRMEERLQKQFYGEPYTMARTHKKVSNPPKGKLTALQERALEEHKYLPGAEEALRALSGRWKMLILYHLCVTKAVWRFSELERAMTAVSQKMLIQQLRELERDGIVYRKVYPEVPPKVEYGLTTLGMALQPALRELEKWAHLRSKNLPVVPFARRTTRGKSGPANP